MPPSKRQRVSRKPKATATSGSEANPTLDIEEELRATLDFSLPRCPWADTSKPLYLKYHDEEWGKPVYDDRKLFEMLCLEGAQAGLTWYTILKKRPNYTRVFQEWDPVKLAAWTEKEVS